MSTLRLSAVVRSEPPPPTSCAIILERVVSRSSSANTSYQLASTPRASGGVRRLFSLPENIALSNYSIPFFERFDKEMAVDGEPAAINFRKGGYLFIVPPAAVRVLERNLEIQGERSAHRMVGAKGPEGEVSLDECRRPWRGRSFTR